MAFSASKKSKSMSLVEKPKNKEGTYFEIEE